VVRILHIPEKTIDQKYEFTKKCAYFWQNANTFLLILAFPDIQRKKIQEGLALPKVKK